MKVVILAAGYATRLYPLTKSFPKPLLEVGARSIIDRLVDDVDSTGKAREYVVVSNALFAGHFREWASKKRLSAAITVLDDGSVSNETRLGAVADILFAMRSLSIDEDMLVMAGDNVLDFSLSSFISYAEKKPGSCAMRYYEPDVKRLRRSGVANVDEDDRMTEMVEKPENPASNWCVVPFYYYKAADLETLSRAVDEGCAVDAPGSALAWLGNRKDVYLMPMPGKRYDIGTLEDYESVRAAKWL
ncbi:MAG: nucleotidyltransferase family protein [Clostridia bacterium]|nr:nucleotidyltransferase family protein [Clostridia bacterium]